MVVIPLLSVTHGQCDARPTVTFPACACTKLILLGDRGICVWTACPRMQPKAWRPGVEPATCWSQVQRPNHYTTEPHDERMHDVKWRRYNSRNGLPENRIFSADDRRSLEITADQLCLISLNTADYRRWTVQVGVMVRVRARVRVRWSAVICGDLHFRICLCVCVLYAFVPHLVNQHIDNLFSLWTASIDKHIASLAARHCAFFSLSLHFRVSLCTVDNKLIDWLIRQTHSAQPFFRSRIQPYNLQRRLRNWSERSYSKTTCPSPCRCM